LQALPSPSLRLPLRALPLALAKGTCGPQASQARGEVDTI